MEELNLARIEGKSYEEIQEDVIRIVNYFTNLWYNNYPVLNLYNYDKEQIVTDVYHGLYLRTKDDGLSNLERHFIKASSINATMSYISNLIRKSVDLTLKCRARDVVRKPICDSMDRIVYSSDGKDVSLSDMVADNSESLESLVELKVTIDSIPNKKFKKYYYLNAFEEKTKLTTKKVLDWIISGYSVTEMREKVFCVKDNKSIGYKSMNEIKKETVTLARQVFYE